MKNKDKVYIDQIRQKLIELTNNPRNAKDEVSESAVARGIGRSNATINLFKNGKYTGNNLKVAEEIDRWMNRVSDKRSGRRLFQETIKTFAVRKIYSSCRIAHVEGKIVVATGDAGVGKSVGVKKYVEDNPDVIHVQVIPYYTAKDVMSDIHKAVGFNGEGRLIDMFKQVAKKLTDSNRLLLIDEAELLPYRGLELVRRLYDLTDIGVCLVGMPKLISNMRGQKGEYKQLYSRIAIHAEIPSMSKKPEDIEALVHSVLPNSNGLWKKFAGITQNARTLENLIDQSIRIAEKDGCNIDDDIIERARKLIIL